MFTMMCKFFTRIQFMRNNGRFVVAYGVSVENEQIGGFMVIDDNITGFFCNTGNSFLGHR